MKKLIILLMIFGVGCSAHNPTSQLLPTVDESQIISAAINNEISHSAELMTRRPVAFLDQTDNWFPADDETPIVSGLRAANKDHYVLSNVQLPNGISLYSADLFRKNYTYASPSKKMIAQFGKEPYVLSTTRPYLSPDGKAHLLLQGVSTWSGCGGINLVHLSRLSNNWVVDKSDLYLFW